MRKDWETLGAEAAEAIRRMQCSVLTQAEQTSEDYEDIVYTVAQAFHQDLCALDKKTDGPSGLALTIALLRVGVRV